MYAETDFLLALVKDEDWLGERAETVYRAHRDELWTSGFTLIELLLVAYREGLDAERVVANAAKLVEVRGDVDTVVRRRRTSRTTDSRRSTHSTSSSRTGIPSSPATRHTSPSRRDSTCGPSAKNDAPEPRAVHRLPDTEWIESSTHATEELREMT